MRILDYEHYLPVQTSLFLETLKQVLVGSSLYLLSSLHFGAIQIFDCRN